MKKFIPGSFMLGGFIRDIAMLHSSPIIIYFYFLQPNIFNLYLFYLISHY